MRKGEKEIILSFSEKSKTGDGYIARLNFEEGRLFPEKGKVVLPPSLTKGFFLCLEEDLQDKGKYYWLPLEKRRPVVYLGVSEAPPRMIGGRKTPQFWGCAKFPYVTKWGEWWIGAKKSDIGVLNFDFFLFGEREEDSLPKPRTSLDIWQEVFQTPQWKEFEEALLSTEDDFVITPHFGTDKGNWLKEELAEFFLHGNLAAKIASLVNAQQYIYFNTSKRGFPAPFNKFLIPHQGYILWNEKEKGVFIFDADTHTCGYYEDPEPPDLLLEYLAIFDEIQKVDVPLELLDKFQWGNPEIEEFYGITVEEVKAYLKKRKGVER